MRARSFRTSRQHGFLLLEVSLALIIVALAGLGATRALLRAQTIDFANVQADVLITAQRALNSYIFQHYIALQNDQAVTFNGVTLANGVADGQSRRPTVANLRAMGYLPSAFSTTAVLNTGTYRFSVSKGPTGCVTSACQVDGLLWIDQPIRAQGSTEPDGVSVGTIQMRIGGNSAASDLTGPTVLNGTGGGFTVPNPVTGTPAGVIGVRVGFNAEVEAAYVRIGDTRDPLLAGPLTVAGPTTINNTLQVSNNASITGTLTVTSSITAGATITSATRVGATDSASCLRSSLESDGRVIVRRADCAIGGQMDSTGALSLFDSANAERLRAEAATGSLTANTAAGVRQVDIQSTSGQVRAWNAAGTVATVDIHGTNGRVSAQRSRLTTTATAGASCATALEGDVVLDAETTGGTVTCRSNLWRRTGLQPAVAGAACTQDGSLGQSTGGIAFICRGGTWTSLTDRVSRSVLMARYLVTEGTVIPHPTCATGAVPTVVLTPVETAIDDTGSPSRNRYAAYVVSGAGSWTARIRLYNAAGTGFTSSFSGAAYNLRSIAQTYCDFAT
ncbi:MAG: hypothetical protein K0Q43_152 [Ramlibacter sp.]|nr:hypothetical protein [Ramlibacter sp.]